MATLSMTLKPRQSRVLAIVLLVMAVALGLAILIAPWLAFHRHYDVAIDSMYGTGFRGELQGDARAVAEELRAFDGAVVAVDIPSGVQGLSGEVRGVAVRADETVCFAVHGFGRFFVRGLDQAVHPTARGVVPVTKVLVVQTYGAGIIR